MRRLCSLVVALAVIGCGGGSSNDTPPPGPPAPPTGVQVTSPMPGMLRASWTPAPEATSYALYHSEGTIDPATAVRTEVSASAAAGQTITGLTPGATRHVAVASIGAGGEGARSADVVAHVQPLPQITVSAATPLAVSLTWTPVSAGSYVLYRSQVPPVDPVTATAIPVATAGYDDRGVSPGTTYHYAVAATFEGSESALGPEVTVTTGPGAPASLVVNGGDRVLSLAWSSVPAATSYTAYCGPTAGMPDTATETAVTSAVDLQITGVAAGTTYFCAVRSASAAGVGLLSAEVSALTLPAAPVPAVEAIAGGVTLTWPAVQSATSYAVSWTGPTAATAEAVPPSACSGGTCSWTRTGLVGGGAYQLTVAARNGTGEGPASAPLAVTVPAAPAPSLVGVTSAAVSLSWVAVPGADGYALYRSPTTPVSPATATRIPSATSTLTDTSVGPDLAYHYALAVISGGVESAVGPELAVTTLPEAPVLSAAVGAGDVTLTWTDANHAVSYDLYWSDSGPVTTASQVIRGVTSPFVHGPLVRGRTYRYAIVATGAGGASPLSAEASAIFRLIARLAIPVSVPGITSFGQSIPAVQAGDPESFVGQAGYWDLDKDLSIRSGGFDGPFAGAQILHVGRLATSPPTFDSLMAELMSLDFFPLDQDYGELVFSTPLFTVSDGVQIAALSDGSSMGLAPISGARSAFLNATSDSRLQQPLDLRGVAAAATVTVAWKQSASPDNGLLGGSSAPEFRVTLRLPDGSLVETLAPSCAAPDVRGISSCTADVTTALRAQVVLSFELRSAAPGIAEIDDVTVTGAPALANGDFEAEGGWSTNAGSEPQNVTSGSRTLCADGQACAAPLRVTRSFFTAPTSPWARIVDVFENLGAVEVDADVVYATLLGGSGATVLYAPPGVGGNAVAAYDAAVPGPRHDFGLVLGDAVPLYRSASPDGLSQDGGVVFAVRPIRVPPGGRVALASYLVLDGVYTARTGGAAAILVEQVAAGIASGVASTTDSTYRDWLTQEQLDAIVNF